jgi:hypothetical protein
MQAAQVTNAKNKREARRWFAPIMKNRLRIIDTSVAFLRMRLSQFKKRHRTRMTQMRRIYTDLKNNFLSAQIRFIRVIRVPLKS